MRKCFRGCASLCKVANTYVRMRISYDWMCIYVKGCVYVSKDAHMHSPKTLVPRQSRARFEHITLLDAADGSQFLTPYRRAYGGLVVLAASPEIHISLLFM